MLAEQRADASCLLGVAYVIAARLRRLLFLRARTAERPLVTFPGSGKYHLAACTGLPA